MNDFRTKLLLDTEGTATFISPEEKKKIIGGKNEIINDFNGGSLEKLKRDAMSQFQEDKTHHKRSSGYGDINQWDYLNQQGIQNSNSHGRRTGPYPYGASSQVPNLGWNPMGLGVPRQTSQYYPNPHGPMVPAHAHSEYRYNHWNNPSQKNVPNIRNAHSRNSILPQSRLSDLKHQSDVSNSVPEFVGSGGPPSKLLNSPRDMVFRGSPHTEKSHHPPPEHVPSMSPTLRNSTTQRPPVSTHMKPVISNPLSDLQMLVTSQKTADSQNPAPKPGSYQQESVDLSAHSDAVKGGKNAADPVQRDDVSVSGRNAQDLQRGEDATCEKPVELTSKSSEKSAETEISSSIRLNNLENNCPGEGDDDDDDDDVAKTKSDTGGEVAVASVQVSRSPGDKPSENAAGCQPGHSKNDGGGAGTTANVDRQMTMGESGNSLRDGKDEVDAGTGTRDGAANWGESSVPGDGEPGGSGHVAGKRKAAGEDAGPEGACKRTCVDGDESGSGARVPDPEETSDLPTVSSTSAEVQGSKASESVKKTPKKKKSGQKSRANRLSSGQSSSSESQLLLNKKFQNSASRDKGKRKGLEPGVPDRRGPFLHVEGTRESPVSVTVINFPKGDDEDDRDKSGAKKQSLNSSRSKRQTELDYRGKSKNGLFSSTLSSRYDAHTTDHTWVCVFCKKGPHYNSMGDLFGPYIITRDEASSSACDFSGDEKDISDAQKRGGRNKKSLRSNNMVEHFQKMSKKLRRTQSSDSCLVGMTVISDDQVDQVRYEVWVHEQCAVWSPNVYLIGSRVIGMQEAIWSSVKTMCSKCGVFGANIGCVFRNCPNRSHYHCAKENEWSLEQETFISTCHIHKPRS